MRRPKTRRVPTVLKETTTVRAIMRSMIEW